PSAPARTMTSLIAEFLEDLRDISGRDVQPVTVVDRNDGGPAAAADALDGAEGEFAVSRRFTWRNAKLGLECGKHVLRPAEAAADVRAHLDQALSDGSQMEHVVEGRDAFAVRGCQIQRVAALLKGLRRQPAAMAFLGDPQRWHDRRARLRVLLRDGAHLVGELARHQRST